MTAGGLGSDQFVQEPGRLIGGGNAEFLTEGSGASLILAAHELLLASRRVTAHQQSMNSLGALVIAEAKLTKLLRLGELTELEVNLRDPLKRLPVKVL